MGFWKYIKGYYGMSSWEHTKRMVAIIFVFLVVPLLAYSLIKWDPIIGVEGPSLGVWIVLGAYWLGLFFIHKYQTEAKNRRRQLKRLLDGVMNKEERERLKYDLGHGAHFDDEEEAARLGH